VYFHWNVGLRVFPSASTFNRELRTVDEARDVRLSTPFAAGSAIVAVRPMLNLLVEVAAESDHAVVGPGAAARSRVFTVSPGARGGVNVGDAQIVLGMALPFVRQDGETDAGVLGYVSYELPFAR
jgi:hypothetical protein